LVPQLVDLPCKGSYEKAQPSASNKGPRRSGGAVQAPALTTNLPFLLHAHTRAFRPTPQSLQVDHANMHAAKLDALVDHLAPLALAAATRTSVMEDRFRRTFPAVVIDLPCTVFSVITQAEPVAALVARHSRFSDQVVRVAKKVVRRIGLDAAGGTSGGSRAGGGSKAGGGSQVSGEFNGLHLQLEAHPDDWSVFLGNDDALLELFLKVGPLAALQSMLFDPLCVVLGWGACAGPSCAQHACPLPGHQAGTRAACICVAPPLPAMQNTARPD
jgi:hypothetical protein